MKRLFAALKLYPDAEFLLKYLELKKDLQHEQIKWVEEHNIHITLKFFGETEERKIPGICSILKKRATVTPAISFWLAGLGIFGSSYSPKVIWVGIEPVGKLSTLMKNIHYDLKTIGYDPDRQNLVPHLTLGRIKFLRDKIIFNRTIERFKSVASQPIQIKELVLFESILHHDGPEYIALEKFSFDKKELPR
jgi:2'-5' RNA ligase